MGKYNAVAGAIQSIINTNLASINVSSGDADADAAYALGVTNVTTDLQALLVELTAEGFDSCPARPFIPDGFRLHSVATH